MLYDLYRSLHARGETLETLAKLTRLKPSQLSMCFNGAAGRGRNTRKHIAPHLQPNELYLLGWDANGELVHKGEKVPCETNSQS